MSFVRGMTEVVQGGIDHRNAMIASVAFWVGVGCQNGLIFPDLLAELAGGVLRRGITAGGLVAIFMTLFLKVTAPRGWSSFSDHRIAPASSSPLSSLSRCTACCSLFHRM